jgi:AcrR family transcriptional regulator
VTTNGGRLGAKGVRTREALLARAVRRFAADGFRGTSVAEIARDSGLTPAASYAYFASKEALFRAAVNQDVEGLVAEALPGITEGTFDGDWSSLVATLLEALSDHPLARRVLSGLEPERTELLLDIPALIELRHGIARQLRDGQARGDVRRDIDPELVASGLETVVMAILIAVLQTGVAPAGDRAQGVVALLDAAIRREEPTAPLGARSSPAMLRDP